MNPETIFEETLESAALFFHTAESRPVCPLDEELFNHVYHELSTGESERVSGHIDHCERCRVKSLKIATERFEWASLFDADPEQALADALGEAGVKFLGPQKGQKAEGDKTSVITQIKDEFFRWVSPLWEPLWAGAPLTALDMSARDHVFVMEDGEIRATCRWTGECDREPAFIQLSWQAALYSEGTLWVCFVDPDEGETLHEARLGEDAAGEDTFTSDELGFDPSARKWGLSFILSENEK